MGVAGTGASSLIAGGSTDKNETEIWNGTNWTEVNNLNTARQAMFGSGATNTAAIVSAGEVAPVGNNALTETWNGTNWTEVNNMNTARRLGSSGGTSTAALAAGGYTGTDVGITESWNGTNWTEVNDLNTARRNMFPSHDR